MRLLAELLTNATPEEARYLVRDRVEDILPTLTEAFAQARAPRRALRPEF